MHRKFVMAEFEAEFVLVTVPKEVLFTVFAWRLASTVLSILMTFAKQPTLTKESKSKSKITNNKKRNRR